MAKDIRLQNMRIRDFKGIRSLDVAFAPEQTDIYGDNATGKTTVFDAFTWLLFSRDSHNQAQFGIKPLDASGNVREHGAQSVVSATLLIDGEPVTLERSYAEKWTKKRGSANPVMDGHEQKFSINGVPKKLKEFSAYVSSIITEEVFRLLTSPDYFPGVLEWHKRRDILMMLAGPISADDVLVQMPAAQQDDLADILSRHGLDDAMAMLKAERTRLNKARQELPVRIDEATKTLPAEIPDMAEIDRMMADEREGIASLTHQINALSTDAGTQTRIAEIRTQIAELKEGDDQARREAYQRYATAHDEWNADLMREKEAVREAEQSIDRIAADIEERSAKADKLRAEWRALSEQTWTTEDTCPTCGQPLPEEMIEEKRAAFNLRKSQRLEAITEEGKALTDPIPDIRREETKARQRRAAARAKVKQLEANEPQAPDPFEGGNAPEIDRLKAELERVQTEPNPNADRIAQLKEQLAKRQDTLSRNATARARAEAAAQTQERIAELKAKERATAREIEAVDRRLAALEDFTRARVRLVEERVNDRFKIARFKLFSEQINGGLAECCELTADGVPWSDLNSAMRVSAGCDVINTLGAHYGVSAPVFIDNAEGITQLEPLNSQLIRLVVSEPDKTLRVQKVA